MRHNKKFNHLGRTKAHREAMLANMASSLIMHKRINTTVAKAKELRKFVEPIITTAKNDTTPSRRLAFSYLRDKEAVKELFGTVADKVGDLLEVTHVFYVQDYVLATTPLCALSSL